MFILAKSEEIPVEIERNRKVALEYANVIRQNIELLEEKTPIATIHNKPIPKGEFKLRKKILESTREDVKDVEIEALNSVIRDRQKEQLLERLGIAVSEEDVLQEIEFEKRAISILDKDEQHFVKEYISTLGMTEEEYWTKYRPLELKRYLTHVRVQHYVKENRVQYNELDDVEVKIIDEDYKSIFIKIGLETPQNNE